MFRRTRTVADSREFLIYLCRIIDLDPLITDRPRTILFYACFIYPCFFHLFSFYTFYQYRDDIVPFLQCVSLWGAGAQCSFKTFKAYIYRKRIRRIFDFITRKQEASIEDYQVYEKYLKWGKRLTIILRMLLYTLISNIIFFALYLILGIIFNDPKFIFILNIPGLDPNPAAGFPDYHIQLTFQCIALYIGVFELAALDGIFAYFALNAASIGDSLCVSIERMSRNVEHENATHQRTTKQIQQIILAHRQYLNFIVSLDEIFCKIFLLQFGTYALTGSVGLYVGRISDWFAIYAIVVTSLFQLFFYNSIGSVIETKNQDIADEFYRTSWFLMSNNNQKLILFMLQRARTMPTLSVGHLAPLNLETGMSIYKKLYSYFLLLKDAFK
ncbi:Odorant receptor [Sergentomyia squamirostris]